MFKFFNKILGNNQYDKYILNGDEDKNYNKFINNTGFNVFISLSFLVCLFTLFFISAGKPETEFYTVDTVKKQLKPLATYSSPIISTNAIEEWSTNSLLNIFTFNFTNIDEHFDKVKILFTPEGYIGFMNGMNKSGLLNSVQSSSLEVFITPIDKPIITSVNGDNEYNNRTWNVEVQSFISYIGTGAPKNEKVIVSMIINQVPTYTNPNGIAISNFRIIKL